MLPGEGSSCIMLGNGVEVSCGRGVSECVIMMSMFYYGRSQWPRDLRPEPFSLT
jgi:hypothetical protein